MRAQRAALSELDVQRSFWAQRLGIPRSVKSPGRGPWGQGSGKMREESPQGTVSTPRLGTGPALPGTRDTGSGKLEAPGDLDRRRLQNFAFSSLIP